MNPVRILGALSAAVLLFAPSMGAAATWKPLVNKAGVVQPIPSNDTLILPAPTTANASINLPPGTAPTSPNNGDCWTTSASFYCRINGVTVDLGAGGGGSPGGSSGQTQYNNAGSFGGFTWSGGATVVPSTGVITLGVPGPSTLGGIESITCGSHNWVSTISTLGVPACTQPASSDVSGLTYFATGTDAANLTGMVSVNRFNSGTSAGSSTYLSGAGTWTTPAGTGVSSISLSAPLGGGTVTGTGTLGTTSYTAHGIVMGEGSSALGVSAAGTSGQPFLSGGASTDGGYGALDISTAAITGNLAVSHLNSGTSASSATFWSGAGTWAVPSAVTSCANPCIIGTSEVQQVSTAPATTLPVGTISMRTDVPRVYLSLQPTTTVTAVPSGQHAAILNTFTVALPSAPTPGNYMIAVCYDLAALPTTNTGWSDPASGGSVTPTISASTKAPYGKVVYRLAVTGDTASQTPCTGGSSYTNVTITEVSGMDQIFANSIQSIAWSQSNQALGTNAAVVATVNGTTTIADSLGIASAAVAGGYNGGNTGAPITFSGSYAATSTATSGGNSDPTNASASQAFSTNGSTANVTATGPGNITARGITAVLILVQPPPSSRTGPVPIITQTRGTTATAGQIAVASSDTMYGPQSVSQDCTASSTLVFTCLKTNNVSFGTFATQNYATPPAIGGTTPAAGSFSSLTDTGVTGTAANCAYFDNAGLLHGTGTACGSAVGGTVTSVTCGSVTITSSGACLGGSLMPQGRLTLVSGTPVMASDQTAKATLYYDCYVGKYVPYYDGSADQIDAISSCEVSTAMQSSSTGVLNTTSVFDVFWDAANHNICVATNGSGGGWASDTAGSNTARGTIYSAVHNTRGYVTNSGTVAHCYNGATDYGSAAADRRTLLGTIYTTAAGQTGMAYQPTAATGGTANVLGVWNAYNRVKVFAQSRDSTASWTYNSLTIRATDNSAANRISWVDGLQQSAVSGRIQQNNFTSGGASWAGMGLDSTSTAGNFVQISGSSTAGTAATVIDGWAPQLGFHFVNGLEAASSTVTFNGSRTSPTGQEQYLVLELEM